MNSDLVEENLQTKPSPDELKNIYKDALYHYSNQSWNQCHERISKILNFQIFDTDYFLLWIKSGIQSKDIGTSSILFQLKNLQPNLENRQLQLLLAFTCWKSKEIAQSYLILKNLLEEDVNYSSISWYLLGKIFFEYSKVEEAKECFENALQLNNSDFKIYEKLGNIYLKKSEYKEALHSWVLSLYLLKKHHDENLFEHKICKLKMKIITVNCLLKKKNLSESLGLYFIFIIDSLEWRI
jgi:tetratricopeptide (TPR) repeat protein